MKMRHVAAENGHQVPASLRQIRKLLSEEASSGLEPFEGSAIGHIVPNERSDGLRTWAEPYIIWLDQDQCQKIKRTGRCPLCRQRQPRN